MEIESGKVVQLERMDYPAARKTHLWGPRPKPSRDQDGKEGEFGGLDGEEAT